MVLDDDPTGTQAVHDVPALLSWSLPDVRAASRESSSIHLLTNARALDPVEAELVTFDAATAARRAAPDATILLRGDSTLRGHLLAEYRAVTRAAFDGRNPVLLLVPALPAAGRVTLGGVHYTRLANGHQPVHESDFARDGVFAYRSSRLLEWAEQRTEGLLSAERGVEVPLERLRGRGPAAIAAAIREAASDLPAVVAPDVETASDLEVIAAGARLAYAQEVPLLVRAAPAFVGVLTNTIAPGFVDAPTARNGVLVVCGSYVARSTDQLQRLCDARGITPVVVDLHALLSSDGALAAETARAAHEVDERLAEDGVAVLSTPRQRPAGTRTLEAGIRIARGLAAVLPALRCLPNVIVAKGGITAHVTAAEGLGCTCAHVVGPVTTGVALWRFEARGRELSYLIFPGNVGDDDHLANVVTLLLEH